MLNLNRFENQYLQSPSCPFRTSKHIDEGFNLIDDKDDGVISLTTFNFPIALQVTTLGEYISLKENSPLITGNTRSQNFSPNLRPNGGFYISSTSWSAVALSVDSSSFLLWIITFL